MTTTAHKPGAALLGQLVYERAQAPVHWWVFYACADCYQQQYDPLPDLPAHASEEELTTYATHLFGQRCALRPIDDGFDVYYSPEQEALPLPQHRLSSHREPARKRPEPPEGLPTPTPPPFSSLNLTERRPRSAIQGAARVRDALAAAQRDRNRPAPLPPAHAPWRTP